MSGNVEYTITNSNGTTPINDLVITYDQNPGSDQALWTMSYEGPDQASIALQSSNTLTEWVDGVEVGVLVADVSSTSWYYNFPGIPAITDMSSSLVEPSITGEFDAFPCFVAGTRIGTPTGPRTVGELAVGDIVMTAEGRGNVLWVGHRRADSARVIRFRPHSLGKDAPTSDLCVSHDHAMFVGGASWCRQRS